MVLTWTFKELIRHMFIYLAKKINLLIKHYSSENEGIVLV